MINPDGSTLPTTDTASTGTTVARRPPVKYASDLQLGDTIRFLSGSYTITALPAYPNPHLFDFMDDRWRVAKSGDWGMTLDPDVLWAQLDNGVWISAHLYPDQDISFGVPLRRPVVRN
jgi:hypothetical protein